MYSIIIQIFTMIRAVREALRARWGCDRSTICFEYNRTYVLLI